MALSSARIRGNPSLQRKAPIIRIADFNGDGGKYENWQAPITPVVDFNGDGKVDIADVFIMLEHWLTDYPLCDIGPMPWGDGFVDAQDLMVLAEHLFEEENPPVQ